MKTRWKKWTAAVLCAALCGGMLPGAGAAQSGEDPNTYPDGGGGGTPLTETGSGDPQTNAAARFFSARDGGGMQKRNLALNKTVTVSGTEVSDGRFTGPMAADGIVSTDSRWSAAKADEQWLTVDLGQTYNVDQIVIRFHALSPDYKVLISETGEDGSYTEVKSVTDGPQGQAETVDTFVEDIQLEEPAAARYVKYQQLKMWTHSNMKTYGSSIYEMEVYSSEELEPVDTDVNLALDRPVTCSSEQAGSGNNNNPAWHATDGDNATRWASNDATFPQWITVDLGQTCEISRFVCNFYNASERAYKYQIMTSETGKEDDFTVAIDGSGNSSGGLKEHAAPSETKGRFVKVHFSDCTKEINSGLWEFEIYGPEPAPLPGAKDNLALTGTATASSNETDAFTPDKAIDGTVSKESRWSPNKDTTQRAYDAWLQVDLGAMRTVQEIDIKFESEPHAYEVLVSADGVQYTQVAAVNPETEGGAADKTFYPSAPEIVRYIKLHQTEQWKHATNGKYYGGSVYELEAYQEPLIPQGAKGVLETIESETPTVSGSALVLPESPNETYTVSLYGCDNQQIVTLDGQIRKPLVDMPVNVLYKVTNKTDPEDFAVSETDVKFTVPGSETPVQGDNAKPNVVPGLREWKGAAGDFTLADGSAVVLESGSASALAETAKLYQQYFKEMLGRDIAVKTGTPAAGDVFLKLDASLDFLGGEGYTIEADDVLTITSGTAKGVLYGGISLTQVLYQDETHTHFPKGTARDYPKYEVRSGMLDVGRMYIPLNYVKEMGLYMAWFKLNNLQMHINDYWGNAGYSAFRLESTTYPTIVAKDGYYTKEDYKQFQKDLSKYGIEVITEIDSPYHAESFREIDGVKMKAAGQLDIRTDETYASSIQIIKNLMDEYLDGADPVFQGNKYHIGTDEYDKGASEQMRKYTDELIRYTNGKGRETRVWGSLGKNGFNGTTPVTNEATVNLWATYWADAKETYDAGFDVVNTEGGWLYIVPRGNAGYPDRISLADRYDGFEVNNFKSPRTMSMQGGKGVAVMPVAHPQTKGAQFCIWNDMTSFRGGYSEFDVYDRFKNMVALVAEKTWYGEKSEGQTGAGFVARFDAVDERAPGANPGRVVESKGDLVADIDFADGARDLSDNGYDGTLAGGAAVASAAGRTTLRLDGTGALEMPFESVGYPYTAKIEVKLDADTPADTLLFSGADGALYANVDGTGHPGFKRGYHEGTQHVGYTFVWNDVTLPTDEWFTLVLTCDASNTTLYLNGKAQARAAMTDASRSNGFQDTPKISGSAPNDSSTFVLPVERIGENLKGELDGLKLYNRVLTAAEIAALSPVDPNEPVNLALNKPATASSTFPEKSWTPDKAVDGIVDDTTTKASRWSSLRTGAVQAGGDAAEYGETEQWLKIDLEAPYTLDKVTLFWEGAFASHYKLMGSLDDDEQGYFEIKDVTASAAGLHTHDGLNSQPVRYLKVLCVTPKTAKYGYSIFEVEAYGKPVSYTVTFESNSGSAVAAASVENGKTVSKPADPTRSGFTFAGWYADAALTQSYDFQSAVTKNITLYAKWTENTPSGSGSSGSKPSGGQSQTLPDGSTVTTVTDKTTGAVTETTQKPDGTTVVEKTEKDGTVTIVETTRDKVRVETVTTPAGETTAKVTLPDGRTDAEVTIPVQTPSQGQVAVIVGADGTEILVPRSVVTEDGVTLRAEDGATIKIIDNSKDFADMADAAWAKDAADFVTARELFSGTGEHTFSPNAQMERGMLVTVLHRLEGKPAAAAENLFADVPDDKYYTEAAVWAAEMGIVVGTAEGFEPEKAVTREQLAVILYRYAGSPSVGVESLDVFADAADVSAWASDAMRWAVVNGIITGKGANLLDPGAGATRAEVAVMLQRFLAKV